MRSLAFDFVHCCGVQLELPSKEELAKWRRGHEKLQLLRAREEDRDMVAALHHQPIEPEKRHKEFPKLARKRIEKRNAHDAAIKNFEVK